MREYRRVLEVRRYQDLDADAVWELHRSARDDVQLNSGPWDEDLRSIQAFYIDDGGEFLVGELEGRLVAMGALRHVTGSVAELRRVAVHPAFRRRGFARLLVDRLEQRARELGYHKLRLDTSVKQTAAHDLFLAGGYREVGRGQFGGIEVIYFEKQIHEKVA
jgi:ribosomal protein S18 acetylase RimI-like enzyme